MKPRSTQVSLVQFLNLILRCHFQSVSSEAVSGKKASEGLHKIGISFEHFQWEVEI